jgi:CheY-like chemotaxis protein
VNDNVLVALIEIVPEVLGIALVSYVVFRNRDDIGEGIKALFARITRFSVGPVAVEFAEQVLNEAAKGRKDEAGKEVTVSAYASAQVLHRAARLKPLLKGARLLWIDDHPEPNKPLQKLLEGWLERDVDVALSTTEAQDRMKRHVYDAVVTDLGRDDPTDDAAQFLENLPDDHPPFVVYLQQLLRDATGRNILLPRKAFAITVRPDELLNLVMDVLERQRGTTD